MTLVQTSTFFWELSNSSGALEGYVIKLNNSAYQIALPFIRIPEQFFPTLELAKEALIVEIMARKLEGV